MTQARTTQPFDVDYCRRQFPALTREVHGQPAVFFDGPAGSQVPNRVIDAIGSYLATMNANHGGAFVTSQESDALLDEAHRAVADFLGTSDAGTVVFGANMTTLTLALSRSLARTWQPGDEIVVTRLDHDANVNPWVLAARDVGATVRHADIRLADCTLDLDHLAAQLSPRTRLVAVGCASNSSGSVNAVAEIARLAHEAGSLIFLDAVHYAPHRAIDVDGWNCDFLACSAYKFFGPHVGVLWGRRQLLASLEPYKLRPAPDDLPGRWMTGTQSHEGIAGTLAAVEYLADLGRTLASEDLSRRNALLAAFSAIRHYEESLTCRLLDGLAQLQRVTVRGITDTAQLDHRVPTISITHDRLSPIELARYLDTRGIFVWHGNYYALALSERLGLEPEGMVRIGFLHYNTADEVQRLIDALAELE